MVTGIHWSVSQSASWLVGWNRVKQATWLAGWLESSSTGQLVPQAGTLETNMSALLMKLPTLAMSSELLRAARSLHLKSVSCCSGRLLRR